MDMETITRVDKSNIRPFQGLLTGELVDEIAVGKSFAIGALDGDIAAGIAVFYEGYNPLEEQPVIRVKWLYVHPDHRGKGLGDELVTTMIVTAIEYDAAALTVAFDEDSSEIGDFLETWGFSFKEGKGPEICLSLKDVKSYKDIMEFNENVTAVSDIDEAKAKALIRKYLKKSGYSGFLLSKELPLDYYDEDLSGFLGSPDKPTGLVLVHSVSRDKQVIEFISCDDPESEGDMRLLSHACQEAMGKYSKDTIFAVKPDSMEFLLNLDVYQLFKKCLMEKRTEAILLSDDWQDILESITEDADRMSL